MSAHAVAKVPASVQHLDPDVVIEVLSRHAINVSNAAAELGVASADLRQLLWARPNLTAAAVELEERRLDLAEKNIYEALRSDDPRRRDAASMFTIRNSHRARRRGWITTSTSVDVNIQSSQRPIFSWRPMPYELNTEEAVKQEEHRLAEVARAEAEGHQVVTLSWGNPDDQADDAPTIEHQPDKD